MQESYFGYTLSSLTRRTRNGRYSVAVKISREGTEEKQERTFYADDGIWYMLEVEAAKECINLGKNLINKSLVGF